MINLGRISKNPLLRNLILVQLLAIVAGVGTLGLAFTITTNASYQHELSTLRQKVQDSLSEQQEKWRTWKQLNLNDALKEELGTASKMFPIAVIDVRRSKDLPNKLSSDEIVLPLELQNSRDEQLVLFSKVDSTHIRSGYLPYQSSLFLLIGTGIIFVLIILIAAYFIYRNVHRPISRLNQAFESFNHGQEFQVRHIDSSGEIKTFIESVEKMYRQVKENEEKAAVAKIADHVVHDIRSPLSMIDSAIFQTVLPEDRRRTITNAISTMRGILQNLDSKYLLDSRGHNGETLSPQMIADQIKLIVSAKKVEYQHMTGIEISEELEPDNFGIFSEINRIDFDRVMSNLINNAVEAIVDGVGKVSVSLKVESKSVIITVSDSGIGISPNDIPKMGQKGVTINKKEGQGLGLYHAKKTVESWRGWIKIDSHEQLGTCISLHLPLVEKPSWFEAALDLPARYSTVVVFDDDSSVSEVWRQRLLKSAPHLNVLSFSSPGELRKWRSNHLTESRDAYFLSDYEIRGSAETGLDLIEEFKVTDRALLVTSRFEDQKIRSRCERLGLKIIPKSYAAFMPLRIKEDAQKLVQPIQVSV